MITHSLLFIQCIKVSLKYKNVCTMYSLENCYWVTKMSLRRWSAVAKRSFERSAQRRGITVTQECSSECMHISCLLKPEHLNENFIYIITFSLQFVPFHLLRCIFGITVNDVSSLQALNLVCVVATL